MLFAPVSAVFRGIAPVETPLEEHFRFPVAEIIVPAILEAMFENLTRLLVAVFPARSLPQAMPAHL